MDSRKIIEQFYPGILSPASSAGQVRSLWARVGDMTRSWARQLLTGDWARRMGIGALALVLWIGMHVYYYNLLVNLECNVQAAWAQVEAQLQRRFYIQQNLTKIVIDYSQYEKELLTNLTKMRTSVPAAKAKEAQQPPAESSSPSALPQPEQMTRLQLDKLFSNILLVAEQYPQLKLTENFQQFSTVIVDVETQIAERLMGYNDSVNNYTTTLTQFPGNVFGAICGFQLYKFYTPDKEILSFQPVEY